MGSPSVLNMQEVRVIHPETAGDLITQFARFVGSAACGGQSESIHLTLVETNIAHSRWQPRPRDIEINPSDATLQFTNGRITGLGIIQATAEGEQIVIEADADDPAKPATGYVVPAGMPLNEAVHVVRPRTNEQA